MDSDQDMFNDSPHVEELPRDCPSGTVFEYSFVILYKWCVKTKRPFKVFSRTSFKKSEIREFWLKHQLEDKFRLRKLKPISSLPGQKCSIFAKMEKSIKIKNIVSLLFLNLYICS